MCATIIIWGLAKMPAQFDDEHQRHTFEQYILPKARVAQFLHQTGKPLTHPTDLNILTCSQIGDAVILEQLHRPVVFKCQTQQAVFARFAEGRKCATLGQEDYIAWRVCQFAFAVEETSSGAARPDGKIQIVRIGLKNRSAALGPSEVTDIGENAIRMEPPFHM
ncbi:hypothetical protein [uncultured Sphingobium sp.]|uniref:hypothetical protein n=1 Tax=uncultured Sphingobium sp. TaxID=316087 RepID=UPI00259B329F|nr:hypothetical protein [uncultured Sphingobium sp.]